MNTTEPESTEATSEEVDAIRVTKAKARIGKNLTEIEGLYGDLHVQALAAPNDRDFPGGAALDMLGPVADLDAWERKYEEAEHAAANAPKPLPFDSRYAGRDYAGDQEHEIHPVLALDKWSRILRALRNQPTDLEPTLWRAADYIRDSIDWMFSTDADGEPVFGGARLLAKDLSNTRAAMENVLKSGYRAERTRVTCTATDCDRKPRLVKVYRTQAKWDHYECPDCGCRYTETQFKLALSDNLWRSDTERFVKVSDAIAAIETPPQTVWSWMRRGKVTIVCDRISHTLMVWWPDVRQLAADKRERDTQRLARRSTANRTPV